MSAVISRTPQADHPYRGLLSHCTISRGSDTYAEPVPAMPSHEAEPVGEVLEVRSVVSSLV